MAFDEAPDLWPLSGRELRYVVTTVLLDEVGPLSIGQVIERLERRGLRPAGRASKTLSDALRWEVAHGRVRRVGRGMYRLGAVPRSTRWWIRRRADHICAGGSLWDLH